MIKVIIKNRAGSVQHYFHFLLGFCVPLVRFHLDMLGGRRDIPLLVRDCGPMTNILSELPINLKIVPRREHNWNYDHLANTMLMGSDTPRFFANPIFQQFCDFIEGSHSSKPLTFKKTSIVLVEREAPSDFYSSNQAENRGSGATRRAIRNHDEVAAWLKSAYPNSQNVRLAGTSIYEQFALFNNADLVIAQHGAALANIVFMRKGAKLIEIGPCGRRLFHYLSKSMGVQYHCLDSKGNYPIVHGEEISQKIDTALTCDRTE